MGSFVRSGQKSNRRNLCVIVCIGRVCMVEVYRFIEVQIRIVRLGQGYWLQNLGLGKGVDVQGDLLGYILREDMEKLDMVLQK